MTVAIEMWVGRHRQERLVLTDPREQSAAATLTFAGILRRFCGAALEQLHPLAPPSSGRAVKKSAPTRPVTALLVVVRALGILPPPLRAHSRVRAMRRTQPRSHPCSHARPDPPTRAVARRRSARRACGRRRTPARRGRGTAPRDRRDHELGVVGQLVQPDDGDAQGCQEVARPVGVTTARSPPPVGSDDDTYRRAQNTPPSRRRTCGKRSEKRTHSRRYGASL